MKRLPRVAAAALLAALLPVAATSAPHASPSRAADPPARQAQRPDIELKGITSVGLVVEDLTAQAATCGLNRDRIEAAAAKLLTDGGLKVVRNSDEDTYVYLNVVTTTVPGGVCVSRYDAYLYTHTTAKLSYQPNPVLVQVQLLHEAGLAGGTAAGHGDNVLRKLNAYVEQFAARVRQANSGA